MAKDKAAATATTTAPKAETKSDDLKTMTVVLKQKKNCKNAVRYDCDDEGVPVDNIYAYKDSDLFKGEPMPNAVTIIVIPGAHPDAEAVVE